MQLPQCARAAAALIIVERARAGGRHAAGLDAAVPAQVRPHIPPARASYRVPPALLALRRRCVSCVADGGRGTRM